MNFRGCKKKKKRRGLKMYFLFLEVNQPASENPSDVWPGRVMVVDQWMDQGSGSHAAGLP